MKRLMGLSVLLVLSFASYARQPASSGEKGIELLRMCNAAIRLADKADVSPLELSQGLTCIGYLDGFAEGYVLGTSLYAKGMKPSFCPPSDGAQVEQYVRIVAKWLKDNPDQLNESGRMSVLIALSGAFPCHK